MACTSRPVFVFALLLIAQTSSADTCDPHARAGRPNRVAWYAKPSNTSHYIPYCVGGGAIVKGDPPMPDEGTWGWDYQGLLPRRIQLGWWHGRHRQGGSGAYKTDGPACTTCPWK